MNLCVISRAWFVLLPRMQCYAVLIIRSIRVRCLLWQALVDAGVIPGCDMTPEAALMKLSYVLSKDELDINTKRKVGASTQTRSRAMTQ